MFEQGSTLTLGEGTTEDPTVTVIGASGVYGWDPRGKGSVATLKGGAIELSTGGFIYPAGSDSPASVGVAIGPAATLTVNTGTLQINESFTVAGKLNLKSGTSARPSKIEVLSDGSLALNGDVTLPRNSVLEVAEGGELNVNANLTVQSGATLRTVAGTSKNGILKVDGTVIVKDGGKYETVDALTGSGEVTLEWNSTGVSADKKIAGINITGGTTYIYDWASLGSTSKVSLAAKDELGLDTILNYTSPVTFTDEIILAAGTDLVFTESVTFGSGSKLTVPEGATVKVSGTGKILTVASDASATVNGKIEVTDSATIAIPTDITIGTNGAIELATGTTGKYNTTVFIGPSTEPSAPFVWDASATDSKVTLKAGKVTELTSGTVSVNIADAVIASTDTIAIAGKAELDIPTGKKLTVDGKIDVAAEAEIKVTGTFAIPATAEGGTNNGTITVVFGGEVLSYGDKIDGTGKTVVETGGKVAWGEESGSPVYSAGPVDASPVRFVLTAASGEIAGGKFISGNDFYQISGAVSFNAKWDSKGYDIIDLANESFTINADGIFTIPATKVFRVKNVGPGGTQPIRAIMGEAGATIVVTGDLDIEDINAVAVNFYDSSGAKVTVSTVIGNVVKIPIGTYKWTTWNVGSGSDISAWKLQP